MDVKRSKEIEQALYDLRVGIPGEFQRIVDQAKAEALDYQIDNLDRLMKRGKYLYLRDAPFTVQAQ